jgi:DNA (cytosine-5)-methyltransferase 1
MANIEAIDLFCGAGGLSLGAARAGLSVVAGVELDRHAHETHALNFPNCKNLQLDVGALSGAHLLAAAGVQAGALGGLIGGPPCQGFSTIGRKDPGDARNDLFGHFMRLVAETQPTFFLAENVPGILQKKNAQVLENALQKIPDHYHMLPPLEVDASLHGAPTNRTRVFFIGVDGRRLPPLQVEDFAPPSDAGTVHVADALRGLHQEVDPNPPTDTLVWTAVDALPKSEFYLRVQDRIPKGVGNRDAVKRYLANRQTSGHIGTVHSPKVAKRYAELAPGGKDAVSRSVRLKNDGFCHTLRAGTGPDKGSFQAVRPIHPSEPRVITPREAARLQGFPDWFLLPATKWHSFRQIGNSVSPIVAEAVLKVLYRHVERHLLAAHGFAAAA